MSIETLFANKRRERSTVFDPYYQRNYVWDNDKASYFIESILLGTEIPPLVFFNNGKTVEVIDGRQRFETIKRFIEDKFHLSRKGLVTLKGVTKKTFKDLDEHIKDLFWDTKIRIIEFSVVNEPRLDDRKEDLIKKEIFRRYNSGITPLRNVEIEKAKYIDDDFTKYFSENLVEDKDLFDEFVNLFTSDKEQEKNKRTLREYILQRVRLLLVSSDRTYRVLCKF